MWHSPPAGWLAQWGSGRSAGPSVCLSVVRPPARLPASTFYPPVLHSRHVSVTPPSSVLTHHPSHSLTHSLTHSVSLSTKQPVRHTHSPYTHTHVSYMYRFNWVTQKLKSGYFVCNAHKVEVKFSLCLTKHYAAKTYLGSGGVAPRTIDLGCSWSWVVSVTDRSLYPKRERAPGTHWIGGWMGPRAGLVAVSKRKSPSPRRESNPDYPVVQQVA
jgi:hypothetical protein